MIRKFTIGRLHLVGIVGLLVLMLGGSAYYAMRNLPIGQASIASRVNMSRGKEGHMAASAAYQTFALTTVPFADAEIGNPMRGSEYYGGEQGPPNWPATDRYRRFCWRQLEPEQGQYDFSRIDEEIAEAKSTGYTFGWRIMPLNPPHACLPDYLNGITYDNPLYLQRAQALFTALGQRYDSNPYVGLLDMSLFGCWGEWNNSCGGMMSEINRKKLIDMQFQAFPHKRFLMFTDQQDSLDYALDYQRALRTGVRVDCLGHNRLGGARDTLDNDPIVHNQWKVAPLYFEYCGAPYNFAQALRDIRHYHASIVGDGDDNLEDFSSYSLADRNTMIEGYKAAGYRFVLDNITMPDVLNPGDSFQVTSKWTNVNTSPTYLPWNVMIQLRTNDNKVAWQGKSQLDLRQPFTEASSGNDVNTTVDAFALPSSLAHGNYAACIQVVDPAGVYAPLALADSARTSDGAYCVGMVRV